MKNGHRRNFQPNTKRAIHLVAILLLAAAGSLVGACGSGLRLGNVDAVKEAEEYAISCRTDEALAAVARAEENGGLGGSLGELFRVAILRDAGRTEEANAAMAERNKRWKVDAENAAKAEEAVNKTVEQMRAERQKRTGHRMCK